MRIINKYDNRKVLSFVDLKVGQTYLLTDMVETTVYMKTTSKERKNAIVLNTGFLSQHDPDFECIPVEAELKIRRTED